jgi:hypothetical protein
MPMTTSRWMSTSTSKAKVSDVTLTVPSMEFSMATKPRSTARLGGRQHVGHGRVAAPARPRPRSGWVQQRLLGEGAPRPEEPDAQAPRCPGRGGRKRWKGPRSSRPCQDRSVDEVALRQLHRRRPSGRYTGRPTTPSPPLRHLPYTDLGFARVDHHRHIRQGMAEASTGPARRPTRRRASWPSCWPAPDEAPWCSPAPTGRPGPAPRCRPTPAAGPPSRRVRPRWCGGSGPGPPGADPGDHRRHRRPARGRRVRRHAHRPRAGGRPAHRRGGGRDPPPARPPAGPGGRRRRDRDRRHGGGPGQRWWVVSPAPRWWPCPPAPATAAALDGRHGPARHARVVRGRHHRGRHRQRVRCRQRGGPPVPEPGPPSQERAAP